MQMAVLGASCKRKGVSLDGPPHTEKKAFTRVCFSRALLAEVC